MPPAIRRSQRRKRPPAQLDADHPEPAPVAQPKKQRTTSSASASHQSHAPSDPSKYRQCQQTLFLDGNFYAIHWKPPTKPEKLCEEGLRCLDKFGNDTHAYFTTKLAAKLAASSKLNMYRHVGHVVLEEFQLRNGVPLAEKWCAAVRQSKDQFINMKHFFDACCSKNNLVSCLLDSLASEQGTPWTAPLIVLVAERADVIRACDTKHSSKHFDLPVQVYISRLLFELIACRDIQALFSALKPSVPFAPVPKPQRQRTLFRRSPPVYEMTSPFAALLRDVESTGYAGLTKSQRTKIGGALNVELYPYQQQTVRWMLDKENSRYTLNEQFWEERFFTDTPYAKGGSFFYFPMSGEVRLARPPEVRGGMVCEEMGLGKTIEALALIACQKTKRHAEEVEIWCEESPNDVKVEGNRVKLTRLRTTNIEQRDRSSGFHHDDEVLTENVDDIEFPCAVRVKRWPAATTLVVCPESLILQWRQEVHQRTPSLSVFVWPPPKESGRDGGTDIATGEHAKDIVLATYEMVRRDPRLSKICWRRVILDESQVTRRSAALVAKDVFNLRCTTRFLMTGTPIVTSIDDLKGQLACLKLWPFSLEQDGFWDYLISFPFIHFRNSPLLKELLSRTMMRHSKAQNLSLELPSRTYQTLRVDLTGSQKACYYYVLGSCLNEIEAVYRFGIDTRRIRLMMRMLVSLCLSPALLDARALDLARRLTWSRFRTSLNGTKINLEMMSPEDAIKFVAQSNDDNDEMVQPSHRSYAAGTTLDRESDPELKKYLDMTLTALRDHVVEAKLMEPARAKRMDRERLASISAGGVHRVHIDTVSELRQSAIRLKLGPEEEVSQWSRAKVRARLLLYYDAEQGVKISRTVHESGYAALSKLIEKKGNPSCPVCLMDCEERLVVTKCGHLYCFDCVVLLLEQRHAEPRCAICRRDINMDKVVEVERPTSSDDEAKKAEADKLMAAVSQYLGVRKGDAGSSSDGNDISLAVNLEVVQHAQLRVSKPTATEAWTAFDKVGPAAPEFRGIGRNERYPSLAPDILQHIAAGHHAGFKSPKLLALLQLIRDSTDNTKFCVVAGTVKNLKVIHQFLDNHGVKSIGVGEASTESEGRSLGTAAEQFSTDPSLRVFLLNPKNAAGLTLTAATVVVFMEMLVRAADEIQAAARVHRIGQTKPVRIVRIIARDTVEENILVRRGECRSAAEESKELVSAATPQSSDELIMELFRADRNELLDDPDSEYGYFEE